jgi:phage host-nuclease inhibitor protein Gam
MTDYTNLMPLAVAITTVGTAWLTIKKIARDAEKTKKEQAAEIIQEAKEADASMRLKMEAKYHDLELKVKNLETSVEKDISHLKETYNNEIKNLGQKIEELRSELRNQHGQLVQLLTEMVRDKS